MKKNKLQNQLRDAKPGAVDISKEGKFDFSGYWFRFSNIMNYCESLNLKKQIPFLKKVLEKLHPLTFRKPIANPSLRIEDIARGGDGTSRRLLFTRPFVAYILDEDFAIEKLKNKIEGEIEKIERELKEPAHFSPRGYTEVNKAIEKLGWSPGYFHQRARYVGIKRSKKIGNEVYYKNSDLEKLPRK